MAAQQKGMKKCPEELKCAIFRACWSVDKILEWLELRLEFNKRLF